MAELVFEHESHGPCDIHLSNHSRKNLMVFAPLNAPFCAGILRQLRDSWQQRSGSSRTTAVQIQWTDSSALL